jgi:flagellar biosynthesis/type III secretory pathway M-ring protein FliF/YscJ
MTQIEDTAGTTAEVSTAQGGVELAISATEYFVDDEDVASVSLVLTPRQARALARQLLEQADATEYGE